MSAFQLAQVNVAKMRAPLSDPLMAPFVAQLDALNALADASPGFVWRLQEHLLADEERDAALQEFTAAGILINLSVWESVEMLQAYVYRGVHGVILRSGREWFEKSEERQVALWWVAAGHRPRVAEAKARLEHLRSHGDSALAFSFQRPFPAPDAGP